MNPFHSPRLTNYCNRLVLLLLLLLSQAARAQGPDWQQPLAISTTAGSTSEVTTTALDANGNVYVAGSFGGTISLGSITLTSGATAMPDTWPNGTPPPTPGPGPCQLPPVRRHMSPASPWKEATCTGGGQGKRIKIQGIFGGTHRTKRRGFVCGLGSCFRVAPAAD
jgi:hypothetical protein